MFPSPPGNVLANKLPVKCILALLIRISDSSPSTSQIATRLRQRDEDSSEMQITGVLAKDFLVIVDSLDGKSTCFAAFAKFLVVIFTSVNLLTTPSRNC